MPPRSKLECLECTLRYHSASRGIFTCEYRKLTIDSHARANRLPIRSIGSYPVRSTQLSRRRDTDELGTTMMRSTVNIPSSSTQIWLAAGATDMRKGFTGLSAIIHGVLEKSPLSGHLFLFRGRRGDLIKLIWWDGTGLCSMSKRLERGRFIWPQAKSGTVFRSSAQLSMLLEGIDWRHPVHTAEPLREI